MSFEKLLTLDIKTLYYKIFYNFFKQTYMSLDFYKKCLNYLELFENVRGTKKKEALAINAPFVQIAFFTY